MNAKDTARCRRETVVLRTCTEADLPAILDIERASYPTAWTRTAFAHELHNQHGRFMVAEQHGHVVGYVCSWLIIDEVHILNIAVQPACRRHGIGHALLGRILVQAGQAGARTANLEVRRSNRAAIRLYQQFGFETVSVRRGYYADGEDGLLMVKAIEKAGQTP